MADAQVQAALQGSVSEKQAVRRLNRACRAVENAMTDVQRTTRHFQNGESWQARSAAVFVDVLRTSVRAAPLTMLAIAFAAGALLFSGRRTEQ